MKLRQRRLAICCCCSGRSHLAGCDTGGAATTPPAAAATPATARPAPRGHRTTGLGHARPRCKLQLKWLHQAQFAGYYVAADKGYYKAREPRRGDPAGRPRRGALAEGARPARRTWALTGWAACWRTATRASRWWISASSTRAAASC